MSKRHRNNSVSWLNDFCGYCEYCGALPVSELKKGHVQEWTDRHETWKSPATRRSVISIVNAAFNRAEEIFGVVNPIKGLKKPKENPRLASFTPEEEQALSIIVNPALVFFYLLRSRQVFAPSVNWHD